MPDVDVVARYAKTWFVAQLAHVATPCKSERILASDEQATRRLPLFGRNQIILHRFLRAHEHPFSCSEGAAGKAWSQDKVFH